ncbi:MAG: 7TM-DISM domain-containing protein, partial [Marinobacter sp.]|uniref:7TMR-DISMED2 domain-containing protein n=1 Tax=Marinobacter sp. TaxID=50741 RepID=UPI00299E2A1B
MRQILLLCALLGTLITVTLPVHAAEQAWLEPRIDYIRLDPGETMTLRQARDSERWQPVAQGSPNFGYVTDTFWFRLRPPARDDRQILEISYPHLDHLEYTLVADGQVQQRVTTGDKLAFDQRPLRHPNFLVPFRTSDPGATIYLKVSTSGALQVPVRIWPQDAFFEHLSVEDQLHAIYYGILITVIFFNLFIFLALRERTYLYYVL